MAKRKQQQQDQQQQRRRGKPARARYWSERRLERRKVRQLVRHNGMEPGAALVFWRSVRRRGKR